MQKYFFSLNYGKKTERKLFSRKFFLNLFLHFHKFTYLWARIQRNRKPPCCPDWDDTAFKP